MVVRVNQYSNTDRLTFVIKDEYIKLSAYKPYFVTEEKNYPMKVKTSGNVTEAVFTMQSSLTSKEGANIFQVVFRDSNGKIRWYSTRGIFIVYKSIKGISESDDFKEDENEDIHIEEIEQGEQQEPEDPNFPADGGVSRGNFKIAYRLYMLGQPKMIEEE